MRVPLIRSCFEYYSLMRPTGLSYCQFRVSRQFTDDSSKSGGDLEAPAGQDKNRKEPAAEATDKVQAAKRKLTNLLHSMAVETTISEPRESSITHKLAKPQRIHRPKPTMEQMDLDDVSVGLQKRLMKAAKFVAVSIGGKDGRETESALLKMLQTHDDETEAAKQGRFVPTKKLAEFVVGMKIDKNKPRAEPGRMVPVRDGDYDHQTGYDEGHRGRHRGHETECDDGYKQRPPALSDRQRESRPSGLRGVPVDIYKATPLGIFSRRKPGDEEAVKLGTWNRLQQEELRLLVAQPPTNAYEEMIRWTEQRKLWKYPIDNEQGLEEEAQVPFYEHVLLDNLLEGFPEKGPIRQFMEVMIMGLSKNPYITVERKKAYVEWFREYFDDKGEMLRACGVM